MSPGPDIVDRRGEAHGADTEAHDVREMIVRRRPARSSLTLGHIRRIRWGQAHSAADRRGERADGRCADFG